jgi:hypothetical protein
LAQRAIHKLEQGDTEPRRTTQRAIEEVWRQEGIEFEDLADGGFRVSIRSSLPDRPAASRRRVRRLDLGVTRIHSHSSKHRV